MGGGGGLKIWWGEGSLLGTGEFHPNMENPGRGGSLTNLMLMAAFGYSFQPEGHLEPHSEVGSQSLTKHLVEFELEFFKF